MPAIVHQDGGRLDYMPAGFLRQAERRNVLVLNPIPHTVSPESQPEGTGTGVVGELLVARAGEQFINGLPPSGLAREPARDKRRCCGGGCGQRCRRNGGRRWSRRERDGA